MDEPRCTDGTTEHAYALEETRRGVLRSHHRCVLCGLSRYRYWIDGATSIRYARNTALPVADETEDANG
jgi:hypothetical protein